MYNSNTIGKFGILRYAYDCANGAIALLDLIILLKNYNIFLIVKTFYIAKTSYQHLMITAIKIK